MDPAVALLIAAGAVWLLTAKPAYQPQPIAPVPRALQTPAQSARPTRYGLPGYAPEGAHWEIDKNQAAIERVVDPDGNSWALVPDGF